MWLTLVKYIRHDVEANIDERIVIRYLHQRS